jgi:hypothetical protein
MIKRDNAGHTANRAHPGERISIATSRGYPLVQANLQRIQLTNTWQNEKSILTDVATEICKAGVEEHN